MVNVEDAVIAKLKRNNQNFEILVDCDLALRFKRGEKVDISDVLAVRNVLKDSKKGEIAPDWYETFKTENIEEIAAKIVKDGEVQLTADYKKKLVEIKKKQIVALITQSAMDPKTKIAIPPQRIESAIEQTKMNIDPFTSAEEQMQIVVEKLRPILPISFEKRKFMVVIPAQYSSAAYGILKKYGKMLKENWLASGALSAEVEMPAKMTEGFIDELNKRTHGDVQLEAL